MFLEILKNSTKITIAIFVTISLLLIFSTKADAALDWYYPSYNVEIDINKDTTFDVSENIEIVFNGDLNGARRDITLHDPQRDTSCTSSGSLTCGGFELLVDKGSTLDGEKLKSSDYDTYVVTDENTGKKSFRYEKRLHSTETFVTDEEHSWNVTYGIYGGIQSLRDFNGDTKKYFYWNVLPEDRGGVVEKSVIQINLPKNVIFDESRLQVFGDFTYFLKKVGESSFQLSSTDLPSYSAFTVAYAFDEKDLLDTGTLQFNPVKPINNYSRLVDGFTIPTDFGDKFEFFPAGEHDIEIRRIGYKTKGAEINLLENEIENIDIDLEPYAWMSLLIFFANIQLVGGLVLIPILLYFGIKHYREKGVDKNKQTTIIPIFKPYNKMKPYLMGALVDEQVDLKDITSTLIDLAYRGYIKIKEIKKNEFELILQDKDDDLNLFEKYLLKAIFDGKGTRNTKSMPTSFATKLSTLKSSIYSELVSSKYFDQSPDSTRNKYYGIAIAMVLVGIGSLVGLTILIINIIGLLNFFSAGLALAILGVFFLFTARYMPAKTVEGSKAHAEILGFKMYLETAEKYRLQNLTPEEFERYLSYAVMFGVEKEWAKSFKDIYKQKPDWYEGRGDVFDAWILSNMINSFNTSTQSGITKAIASSGKGSGWSSGGGSFGGFSGGGGGGGSSGGW